MHELKNEICHLKNQLEDREKNSDTISMVSFYKSGICLLLWKKLLVLQKDQSKINCYNKVQNKHNNSRSYFDK